MKRSRHEGCVSDLVLDRLILGELKGERRAEAEAHLAGCALCSGRLSELKASSAQFPDEVFVDGLVAQAAKKSLRWRLPSLSVAVVVAASLLLYIAIPRPNPGERKKGNGVSLVLVTRHHDGTTERLLPSARVVPGDAIRFSVSTDGGYIAVVGIDAAHAVSIYYPDGPTMASIGRGRDQLLPGSIVLDETLGPERIVAVVCAEPQPVALLTAAAQGALARAGGDPQKVGALTLPCRQTSVLIEKHAP